jgi:DNA-binding transcriptional MerR regulator/methylmalonyl-CoA mutase cobalamin-binding subunit
MEDAIVHSIKTVSQVTGLTADTLRAWERRYSAVQPRRDDGGRRLYDAEDLTRLRLLRQAVDLGHPIHRVARLSLKELEDLLREARGRDPAQSFSALVASLLDAVGSYRSDVCDEILGLAIAALSPSDAVRFVLAPALVEAGTRWHAGQFTAAQEHLLTASVERLVMTTMHTFRKAARGPGVVFGTLSGERHVVGSLLAAFLAASRGLRCIYLGAELPPAELAQAAVRSRAAAVALSLVTAIPALKTQLARLRRQLPPEIELWLGGSAACDLDESSLPKKCVRFSSFDDFLERVEILRATSSLQGERRADA